MPQFEITVMEKNTEWLIYKIRLEAKDENSAREKALNPEIYGQDEPSPGDYETEEVSIQSIEEV